MNDDGSHKTRAQLIEELQTLRNRVTELEEQVFRIRASLERLPLLSPREREVLDLVATGLTNKAIAYRLDLSHKTVESHRAKMMKKLGVNNVVDLVRLVLIDRLSDDPR